MDHGHPFEWVLDTRDDDVPTGIEVLRFESEEKARAAMAALSDPELRKACATVFRRTRTYLSKYAAGEDLLGFYAR